nr:N-6 DNA methylase [aff. Roholtiella sp. LEGE 12411]
MKAINSPEINLSPAKLSNLQMGYLFEELVRKFNEQANEEAGDHFTPREVIRLMVNLSRLQNWCDCMGILSRMV